MCCESQACAMRPPIPPIRQLLLVVVAVLLSACNQLDSETSETQTVPTDATKMRLIGLEFDELNWSQVDVSPDGRTLLFDALGDLYTVPIEGGDATLLRGGYSWDVNARFSADGSQIAFASNQGKNGAYGIYVMSAKGGDTSLLNSDPYHSLSPEWAGDGKSIVAALMPSGGEGHLPNELEEPWGLKDIKLVVDDESFQSRSKLIRSGSGAKLHSMAPGGRYIYFVQSRDVRRYDTISGDTSLIDIVLATGDPVIRHFKSGQEYSDYPDAEYLLSMRVSPDESFLVYLIQKKERVALRAYDLSTRLSRTILNFDDATALFDIDSYRHTQASNPIMAIAPGFAITPDSGETVVVAAGQIVRINNISGQITPVPFRARFEQLMPGIVRTTLPFETGAVRIRNIRWPSVSDDLSVFSFAAHGKVWIHDTEANETRRATENSGLEFAPAVSPDGRQVAYVDWKDDGTGRLMIVGTENGSRPQALVEDGGYYMNPTWSPDGTRIAFLQAAPADSAGARHDENKRALKILNVLLGDVTTLVEEFEYLGHFNERDNTPLSFSADGRRVYWTGFESFDGSTEQDIWLKSTDIASGESRSHFRYGDKAGSAYDHVIISPDGNTVAIVHSSGVWTVPIDVFSSAEEMGNPIGAIVGYIRVADLSRLPGARHVTDRSATYVLWSGNEELIWSAANKLFKTDVKSSDRGGGDTLDSQLILHAQLERSRVKAEGSIAYTDARILTMADAGVIENGTILVEDNVIVAVDGAENVDIPRDAAVLSLAGKTVMPGMIDAHAHPTRGDVEYFKEQNPYLISNLAYGVTTLFEVSGAALSHLTQGEMVEAGDVIGPRGFGVGGAVFNTRYNDDDYETMLQLVRDKKEMGARGLKSYGIEMQGVRRALIEAARAEGLNVVAHIDSRLPWSFALYAADGVTALEHSSNIKPVANDWIRFFAATEVHFTPTTPVDYRGIAELFVRSGYADDEKVNRFLAVADIDRTLANRESEAQYFGMDSPIVRTAYKGLLNVLRAGGHVSIGLHGELNGPDAHLVLEALVMNGFTPLEAISTLTSEPAHKLGLENTLGSLKAGHMADFIVLNSNPLDDIKNSLDIQYVVKNGFVYDDDSVTQLWPEYVPYKGPFGGDAENYPAGVPPALSLTDAEGYRSRRLSQ